MKKGAKFVVITNKFSSVLLVRQLVTAQQIVKKLAWKCHKIDCKTLKTDNYAKNSKKYFRTIENTIQHKFMIHSTGVKKSIVFASNAPKYWEVRDCGDLLHLMPKKEADYKSWCENHKMTEAQTIDDDNAIQIFMDAYGSKWVTHSM